MAQSEGQGQHSWPTSYSNGCMALAERYLRAQAVIQVLETLGALGPGKMLCQPLPRRYAQRLGVVGVFQENTYGACQFCRAIRPHQTPVLAVRDEFADRRNI